MLFQHGFIAEGHAPDAAQNKISLFSLFRRCYEQGYILQCLAESDIQSYLFEPECTTEEMQWRTAGGCSCELWKDFGLMCLGAFRYCSTGRKTNLSSQSVYCNKHWGIYFFNWTTNIILFGHPHKTWRNFPISLWSSIMPRYWSFVTDCTGFPLIKVGSEDCMDISFVEVNTSLGRWVTCLLWPAGFYKWYFKCSQYICWNTGLNSVKSRWKLLLSLLVHNKWLCPWVK